MVGVGDEPMACGAVLGTGVVDDSVLVTADDLGGALLVKELDDCGSSGSGSGDDDAYVSDLLADHAECVDEGGQDHDRCAVLVVVENGDVQLGSEPPFDVKASWCGDVLEVDAPVDRSDGLHDLDDLVGVLGVEADEPSVDTGETLEQRGLASNHG